ncbi:hypothetical protein JAAARDRAFT_143578, partial [Jaapia argillacea MUCL 33604]
TPNNFMHEWLDVREVFLNTLLKGKSPPDLRTCVMCAGDGIWHCGDCLSRPLLCASCCRAAHQHLPFHRVEQWLGGLFQPGWLSSLGIKIHLGHGGAICPTNQYAGPSRFAGSMEGHPSAPVDKSNPFVVEDDDDEEGINWRDELDEALLSEKSNFNRLRPKLCGRTMIVVDTLGVHELTMNFCSCADKTIQLLDLGLYPGSVKRPATTFTFKVLDDFTQHNVECKMNTQEYYETLCRVTRPAFPQTVPDCYREMMRCSWQWRHLKTLKWQGFGYGPFREPGPGELTLFCLACPQVGVNLPDNWEEEAERLPWLFSRQLNMDGNFKAEQMHHKYPDDGLPLTRGSLFLCEDTRYNQYIAGAKPTCHDHKAQSQANTQVKHLAITSIVAVVCARHGWFCPGSCVNLQKGERQINMDYILAQALNLTKIPGITPTMVLYDIICQYGVHVTKRFLENAQYLGLSSALNLIMGIGLFHVHGHQDSCRLRYSPNYMISAGQVDGEVIETLWARLNEIAVSCWPMGHGHRTEMLDFHILNSNWQKTIGMVSSLCRKLKRAHKHVRLSAEAFADLNSVATETQVHNWRKMEKAAAENRQDDVSAMDVYAPIMKKAPTQSEIQHNLSQKEGRVVPIKGSASWLASGIAIQEAQCGVFKFHVRKMGRQPTVEQLNQIEERRRRLDGQIDTFERSAARYLVQDASLPDAEPADDPSIVCVNAEGAAGEDEYEIVFDEDENALWEDDFDYDAEEVSLRIGQANDLLQQIHIALGHKSFLYRTEIRHNKSQSKKTRSWSQVGHVEATVQKNSQLYKQCRKAMGRGRADEDLLAKYKDLKPEDLKMHTGVVDDPAARGTRQNTLAWFWTVNLAANADEKEKNDYLDDCE